jgi:hypothetical protein
MGATDAISRRAPKLAIRFEKWVFFDCFMFNEFSELSVALGPQHAAHRALHDTTGAP